MKTTLLLCVAVMLLISAAKPSGAAPAPEPGKAQSVSGGAGEDVRAASQSLSTQRGSWAAGQASAEKGAVATASRSSS